MRKYKDIPQWWFYVLLVITVGISLVMCIKLNDQVQMPWWALIFACALAYIFTLPIAVITATTNQVGWNQSLDLHFGQYIFLFI